ncbi:MAG: hypothetical protein GF353_18340, partial [Candidatus Lokiarchaeota archaeon]|nr:hypothetical protein [Candidatus Lokiarchaeota archaeon]
MIIDFELIKKKCGYSRVGRIKTLNSSKNYLKTPVLLVPINKIVMQIMDFVLEFKNHRFFIISNEDYLKTLFLKEQYENSYFIFAYNGTLLRFQEIIKKKKEKLLTSSVIPLIPFNNPTTTLDIDFTVDEIHNYLEQASMILEKNKNLDFGLTIRTFHYSETIDLYLSTIKKHKNLKILNLMDIFDDLNRFRQILKTIIKIKKELDNNLILMVSGRILPNLYPMLIYLGVDLIDSSYLLFLSSENFYNTTEFLLPIYKLKYLPCNCVACRGNLSKYLEEKYSLEKLRLLCVHNLMSANAFTNKIKQYLNYEDYRFLTEKSAFNDTYIISMLKILDKECFDALKYETPRYKKIKSIKCLGASSYHRPDFNLYRERVVERFNPESWTRLVFLFPCSAQKPYSKSNSHQKFLRVLRKFSEFPSFQEFILTSPLGVVPRQLEDIYPPNSYDIS